MPFPMKSTAKRFGKGELEGVAANADSDSSHGRADGGDCSAKNLYVGVNFFTRLATFLLGAVRFFRNCGLVTMASHQAPHS